MSGGRPWPLLGDPGPGAGTIISLVVLKHPLTGQSKGIGLVRFSSVGEARRAKELLHGIPLQADSPMEVCPPPTVPVTRWEGGGPLPFPVVPGVPISKWA